jgi:molecular chaperone DnaK (HSP70)
MTSCKAIGIDLGTSYASIAIVKDNKIELLTDKYGNNRMPCMVHFRETDRLYFEDAKEHSRSPNTVFDINRLIGREREDFELKKCLRYCPFKVVNEMNKTKIEVFYENELKRFYPEEIMAMMLSKLKEIAEQSLGYEVINGYYNYF